MEETFSIAASMSNPQFIGMLMYQEAGADLMSKSSDCWQIAHVQAGAVVHKRRVSFEKSIWQEWAGHAFSCEASQKVMTAEICRLRPCRRCRGGWQQAKLDAAVAHCTGDLAMPARPHSKDMSTCMSRSTCRLTMLQSLVV